MKRIIFGFTLKELRLTALFVVSSLTLIVYSSVKLIRNHNTNNHTVQTEIHNQSKCLAYLNNLNEYTLNTQRSSVNMLVYRSNLKEITNFKNSIAINRDGLLLNLNRIDSIKFTLPSEKKELLLVGLNYLNINAVFIKMFTNNINIDSLSIYNLQKMRPAVRLLIDSIRKSSKIEVEKIQGANNNSNSIFSQLAFWLLLIGLAPYIYFLYRILVLIIRMIIWEVFP